MKHATNIRSSGGISWNLSSLTICHSLTSTVTFLILIGYEALSLTVAMVIVSEWQIVSDEKFHEMPARTGRPGCLELHEQCFVQKSFWIVNKFWIRRYHSKMFIITKIAFVMGNIIEISWIASKKLNFRTKFTYMYCKPPFAFSTLLLFKNVCLHSKMYTISISSLNLLKHNNNYIFLLPYVKVYSAWYHGVHILKKMSLL